MSLAQDTEGAENLTLYPGELCQIVNNNLACVNMVVNKWHAFTRSISSKDRNPSKTKPGWTQNLLSPV